jgi:hypothetical protein
MILRGEKRTTTKIWRGPSLCLGSPFLLEEREREKISDSLFFFSSFPLLLKKIPRVGGISGFLRKANKKRRRNSEYHQSSPSPIGEVRVLTFFFFFLFFFLWCLLSNVMKREREPERKKKKEPDDDILEFFPGKSRSRFLPLHSKENTRKREKRKSIGFPFFSFQREKRGRNEKRASPRNDDSKFHQNKRSMFLFFWIPGQILRKLLSILPGRQD